MRPANQNEKRRTQLVCLMKPLRRCLDENNGDLKQCKEEVKLFQRTCDKRLDYVHDRDGLDDNRTGLYTGKKHM